MIYPFVGIGLIIVFIAYVLYLIFYKKDFKALQNVILPGIVFILIWAAIYYYPLKD